MHLEAHQIFFSQNTWRLDLNLYCRVSQDKWYPGFDEEIEAAELVDIVVETRKNTAQTIRENWGVDALHMMRNVKIAVQGNQPKAAEATKDALGNTIRILKEGGNVSRLVVKWKDFYRLIGN
jgi:hypothetical protein